MGFFGYFLMYVIVKCITNISNCNYVKLDDVCHYAIDFGSVFVAHVEDAEIKRLIFVHCFLVFFAFLYYSFHWTDFLYVFKEAQECQNQLNKTCCNFLRLGGF